MSQPKLSLLAEYDDVIRCYNSLISADCENEFLKFVIKNESLWNQWQEAGTECRRLQQTLDECHRSSAQMVTKLRHAQKLLDQERKARKTAEIERQSVERLLDSVREILTDNHNRLNDETKEKLSLLNNTLGKAKSSFSNLAADRLDTITEFDSTGSLLSDMSYSRSEDDLDVSFGNVTNLKKHLPIPEELAPSPKRRRSNIRRSVEVKKSDVGRHEQLIATTTVTVHREGNVRAQSKIETKAPEKYKPTSTLFPSAPPISSLTDSSNSDGPIYLKTPQTSKISMAPPSSATRSTTDISPSYSLGRKNFRLHSFVHKIAICPEKCNYCEDRLKFGKARSKCQDCRAVCHQECEQFLPLPCVPCGNTPAMKGNMGTIADYTPMTSPMVPAIIVHCIREIESRGLGEVGIYRVPGSERDVKALKESFLRGKGAPNLSNVDVHVICGVVKSFLRSLQEHLILRTYWHDFVRATEIPDPEDAQAALYQAISELPQPNRDTLAALVLHLQHVAECVECKMPVSNLAKIFGPTIVGYSTSDPDPNVLKYETEKQAAVMDQLLRLPSDYWANFANPSGSENNDPDQLPHTPSASSLRSGAKNFLCQTPRSLRGKKKFFSTPPAAKQ